MSGDPPGGSLPVRPSREGATLTWAPPGSLPWDVGEPTVEGSGGSGGEFWKALRRRWGVIVIVLGLTLLVTALWLLVTPPTYTATTTLRIEKEEPRVLTFDDVAKQIDPLPDALQTQQRLLQSRTLANRVITRLSLAQHPDFQDEEQGDFVRTWTDGARAWVRERLAAWRPPPSPPGPLEGLVVESPLTRVFQSRLAVEPVRGSRLVKVSFESRDPALAARVANTLSDAFLTQALETKATSGRYASGFLAKQLGEARGRLEDAEVKLNVFLKANGINFVSPATLMGRGNTAGTERQDLVTQQLATLSDALLKARGDRIAKESLVQQAQSRDIDALPAVLQSPLIVKLKGDLSTVEAEYQQLSQTFRPEYPRMRQLQKSIGEMRAQVRAEVDRIVKGLETDFLAARQNERQVERAMDEQRSEALKLGDKMVAYNILRRDVDAGRELYTSLLTRLKETQISADLLTSPISIVDRAEVPLWPSRPRKSMSLLLAGVLGLLSGVIAALISDRFDPRIRTEDEVERLLGVPRLGLVPRVSTLGRRYGRRGRLVGPPSRRLRFALVTHLESASHFAEAFRELRTSILYSSPGRPPRTVMVTSLEAGDGKTALAMNLAVALAQLGSGEVLLVDANLRHPELHTILGVSRTPGLAGFLSGTAELGSVVSTTGVPRLHILPAGRRPQNPAELLASRRFNQALESLYERFDHIIVDAPPLFGVSDALNLAPRLDGVVLVLRHGRASRDEAQEAVQRLWLVRANLLGVVVNGVDGAMVKPRRDYYRAWRDDDAGHDER
jgi:capsular exopolysaccharide synthesis family protein